ncbi:hypothetical protein ILUMI_14556 [Ignelater luminosus]|uniref:RNA-directed DNA polymerase n=1 Tax=Ignelater luminosus TaxID=2038154 RepID=A0A8K0CUJ7_IGNLU|nr:hypothetical protein ILUMI_14556 [Ignelater luminosus]
MRPYLEGYHLTFMTDHQSLRWLHSIKSPTGRLARWSIYLQQFDFEIQYRKGVLNRVADTLSQNPQPNQEDGSREVNAVQIPKCSWYHKKLQAVQQHSDQHPDYCLRNDSLYRHFPLNSLKNEKSAEQCTLCVAVPFRTRVLEENHDAPTAGHLGITKTINRITHRYYPPGMFRDIGRYVRHCQSCQRFKASQQQTAGKMYWSPNREPKQGRYNLRRRDWKPRLGEAVLRKVHLLFDDDQGFAAKLAPKYSGPYLMANGDGETVGSQFDPRPPAPTRSRFHRGPRGVDPGLMMSSRILNIIRGRIQQLLQNHYPFYIIKRELKKENIKVSNCLISSVKKQIDNYTRSNLVAKASKRKPGPKRKLQGKNRALFVKNISKIDSPTQRALFRKYSIGRTTVQSEISRSARKKKTKGKRRIQYITKTKKRASAARFEGESHPKGVMVSLGISFKGITKPIFVNAGAKINSKYYQQNILNHYEKELRRLYSNNDGVFHQDSAPSHASKSTIKWPKDRNIKFILPEEWMPSSPNCAPCDYFLWSYRKTHLDEHNHKPNADLRKSIMAEVEKVPQEMINAALTSWSRRVRKVYYAKGGHIGY